MIFTPQTQNANPNLLLNGLRQQTSEHKIVYTGYGNPYQSDFVLTAPSWVLQLSKRFLLMILSSYQPSVMLIELNITNHQIDICFKWDP